jgi:serine/threonine protein kinase
MSDLPTPKGKGLELQGETKPFIPPEVQELAMQIHSIEPHSLFERQHWPSNWWVRLKSTREWIAVKTAYGNNAEGKLLQLSNERIMLNRLGHIPKLNTQRIVDLGIDDERLLATEAIVGSDMARFLYGPHPSTFHLSTKWLVPFIVKFLEQVSTLHGQEIVHLDIKPSNLLVRPTSYSREEIYNVKHGQDIPVLSATAIALALQTGKFELVLTDHGLTHPTLAVAQEPVGTPVFRHPELEQATEDNPVMVDIHHDVHSAAVTIKVLIDNLWRHCPPLNERDANCIAKIYRLVALYLENEDVKGASGLQELIAETARTNYGNYLEV